MVVPYLAREHAISFPGFVEPSPGGGRPVVQVLSSGSGRFVRSLTHYQCPRTYSPVSIQASAAIALAMQVPCWLLGRSYEHGDRWAVDDGSMDVTVQPHLEFMHQIFDLSKSIILFLSLFCSKNRPYTYYVNVWIVFFFWSPGDCGRWFSAW